MIARKKIDPKTLVAMDVYAKDAPVMIDLAYARPDNLLFGERIYKPDARLWLHKDLAAIVVKAAKDIYNAHGLKCILFDGLRTTDAQERMLKTRRVQENPHWLEEPRLLSPPGAGAHPRGMAIDISIERLDMGTPFDDLTDKAHRKYPHAEAIHMNRALLEDAMMRAADDLNLELFALPQEWWDYRMPQSIYESFDPLSESDLPEEMHLL